MSEPTKALLIVLAIIFVPLIGYFGFHFVREYYRSKNAVHINFKKHKGKVKGYTKTKNGAWQVDDDLYLEDKVELTDKDQ